ncbi:MAG: putative transporter YoaV [Deltaproteobacteria bacterium]|nr:MAG: putative transporter YoaV [Deltaproteobacteria bacterium]
MWINVVLLAFVIITWGYSWILMKVGLKFLSPFTFATWRCGIGGLAMLPILYIKGSRWPKGKKWLDYMVVGLFQTTAMFGFMLYGMQFVTAGKTSVLLYTMPIWTVTITHFFLGEKITTKRLTGAVLGTAGIVCILGWDTILKQNLKTLVGEILILIGAISWAISNIWVKRRMSEEDPYVINGLQMLLGTLGLIVLSLPKEHLFNINWTWTLTGILLFTSIIASTVNFTIWFYLLGKLDIHTTTFSSMLVPVFGLILDWIHLGNKLDTGILVGGVLILAGIYRVSNQRSHSDNSS